MHNLKSDLKFTIPANIEESSAYDKVKFLMVLHFSYKNSKEIDASQIELEPMLDYISAINRILDSEMHNKVRLIALETLREIIDVILKYFSMSCMSQLRHSERLMIISIMVKRNCFPIFCVPARQPRLDLSYLEDKTGQNDDDNEKLEDLMKEARKSHSVDKIVKAVKVSEEVLTKSITDLMGRVKLRLFAGIEKDEFTKLTLDELQMISLMMNDPDFTLIQTGDVIKLRKNKDIRGLTGSESVIIKPTHKGK